MPFDVRFFWNLPSTTGDRYLSATEWYADVARSQLLGSVPLQFNRGEDDVAFAADAMGPVKVGQPVTFTTSIQPNFTAEDRSYTVFVPIPDGLEVDPASINEGGVVSGGSVVWTVTQESLLGREGVYSISTNADNAYCDTGFGGYVNLADFGIPPDPTFTGDTIAGTFFSGQNPVEFYGDQRDGGLTVTDDGFGFFESTPGPAPWENLPIPDPTEPNDMLAPFWSDWVINYDVSGARVRGISAATAGPDVSVVEWDGVEWYPGDGSNPIAGDFELVMFSTVDPVFPEFVFAYDNLDGAFVDWLQSFGFVTSGVESRAGTAGSEYRGPYFDGLIVCYDYIPVGSPRQLTFSATVQPSLHSQTVTVTETNTVDNPGSEPVSSSVDVEVIQLPYIFKGFLGLRDGKKINVNHRWVSASFLLFDPVTHHIVRDAEATIEVTAADGTVVAADIAELRWFIYKYRWRISGLELGDYTITAYLDDGTSHSVSVTLVKRRRWWWWW